LHQILNMQPKQPFFWFLYSLFLFPAYLSAQSTQGLALYVSFDNCQVFDESGNNSVAEVFGAPECICGVDGDALLLDGENDYIHFNGFINNIFQANNFTLSMYVKPYPSNGVRTILSKRDTCMTINSYEVRHTGGINFLENIFLESQSKRGDVNTNLGESCWYHYVWVRQDSRTFFYVNGQLIGQNLTNTPVNLSNSGLFSIADGPCIGVQTERFRGAIDELRIYNRPLDLAEVRELYSRPDRILNADTTIFLGDVITGFVGPVCTNNIMWSPSQSVSDVSALSPVLSPTETTVYTFTAEENGICRTVDSFRVAVIDPSLIDCTEIFLPNAFTPNNDFLNDVYGISNPIVIQELISLEIFDRTGSRVFKTTERAGTWDGIIGGREAPPGTYLYHLRYMCDGVESFQTGTLTLIR
jgi:gliding motility-associated-like protein